MAGTREAGTTVVVEVDGYEVRTYSYGEGEEVLPAEGAPPDPDGA